MPAERITMRKLREIVRLLAVGGLSKREIASRAGVAASTVREAAKKISAAGLAWPLPAELCDAELEALLYKNAGKKQGHRRIPEPDWAVIPTAISYDTFAQVRVAMDAMRSGMPMRVFQASQHASTISS